MLEDRVGYEDDFLKLCNGVGVHSSSLLRDYSKFADVGSNMKTAEVRLYFQENCGVNLVLKRDKKQYAVDIEKRDMNQLWDSYTKVRLKAWDKKMDPDIISAATGLLDLRSRLNEILKQGYGTDTYQYSNHLLPRCVNDTSKQFSLYEGHGVKKGQIVEVMLTSMVPWRGLLRDAMSRRIMVVEDVNDEDVKDEGASMKLVTAYGDLHHWSSLDVTEINACSPSNCALISWLLWIDPGRIFYKLSPRLTLWMQTLAVTEKDCAIANFFNGAYASENFQHFVCTELAFMNEDDKDKPSLKYAYYLWNNNLPDVIEEENTSDGQRRESLRHRTVSKTKLIAYLSTLAGSNLSSKGPPLRAANHNMLVYRYRGPAGRQLLGVACHDLSV